jgi:hypothetical protein
VNETPDRSAFRASDADREQVAEALRQAAADGRLTLTELDERIEALYAAKTYGELEPVVSDLPGVLGPTLRDPNASAVTPRQSAIPSRIGGRATGNTAVAIFGGAARQGEWVVASEFTAVAVFGGVELNLTEATLESAETLIRAVAVFGGVDITVPHDVRVVVDGMGVFGGYADDTKSQPPAGAPVVRITGAAVFGGVNVKRSKRK